MIIKKLFHSFFDYGEEIKYRSSYPLAESVKRLSSITRKKFLSTTSVDEIYSSRLVGSVTEQNVVLHRARLLFGNMQKPYFFGKFEEVNGGVVLVGVFSTSNFSKIFALFNFVILVFVEATIIFSLLDRENTKNISLVIVQVIFVPAIVLISIWVSKYIKRWSSKDIEWVSDRIVTALR